MDVENGLENVVAAETALSHVDGAAGKLIICGRSLDTLAANHAYEDVVALMLTGQVAPLPEDMTAALGRARAEVYESVAGFAPELGAMPVIDGLRTLMAMLPDGDDTETALRLIAAPAVCTAVLLRTRSGRALIPPRREARHAADILHMCGLSDADGPATALDRYLMTVTDHGLNASTFAARVVASTGAGLASAAIAALCALKGPLHGGAPGPVLDMLDGVGTPENAARWIADALGRGKRLMGFGHRVYRVRDPRADVLRGAVQLLRNDDSVATNERLALAEAVEAAALDALARHKPDRKLETNVEFYTATLLEALGVPRDAFTCVFAMGRVTGWVAHAREQARTGRLIRPQSRYTGPMPERAA